MGQPHVFRLPAVAGDGGMGFIVGRISACHDCGGTIAQKRESVQGPAQMVSLRISTLLFTLM